MPGRAAVTDPAAFVVERDVRCPKQPSLLAGRCALDAGHVGPCLGQQSGEYRRLVEALSASSAVASEPNPNEGKAA